MYDAAKKQGMVASDSLSDWSFHASINLTQDCTDKELEAYNELAFREFTMAKRYGKHYLFNPFLWIDGLRSVLFLMGKRDFTVLLKKAWGVIRGK